VYSFNIVYKFSALFLILKLGLQNNVCRKLTRLSLVYKEFYFWRLRKTHHNMGHPLPPRGIANATCNGWRGRVRTRERVLVPRYEALVSYFTPLWCANGRYVLEITHADMWLLSRYYDYYGLLYSYCTMTFSISIIRSLVSLASL